MTSLGQVIRVQMMGLIQNQIQIPTSRHRLAVTHLLLKATLNQVRTPSNQALRARVSRSPNLSTSARIPTSTPSGTKAMRYKCIPLGARDQDRKTPMILLNWNKVELELPNLHPRLKKLRPVKSPQNLKRERENQLLIKNLKQVKSRKSGLESLKK